MNISYPPANVNAKPVRITVTELVLSQVRSRRVLKVVVRASGSCRMHKVRLAAIERLGYLTDGY